MACAVSLSGFQAEAAKSALRLIGSLHCPRGCFIPEYTKRIAKNGLWQRASLCSRYFSNITEIAL